MSTLERTVSILGLLAAASVFAQEGPNLGVEATAEQVAGWAISIQPDGAGLPAGSGRAADGAAVYAAQCLACHGEEGVGGLNDRLVGGHGTIASDSPVKTVGSYWPYATTVFDYIRRSMPILQPQSLTNDEVYAVTAYLLELNGIIDEGDVMSAETLPQVQMPNADNFVWAYIEE